MNQKNKETLENFYSYSKEVMKALQTLESFMKDEQYKHLAETHQEHFKKNRIPKDFYQYLSELEEIY